MKKILAVLMIIITFCIGCQNDVMQSTQSEITQNEDNTPQQDTETALLRVNISESKSRTAMPELDLSMINYVGLSYEDPNSIDPSNDLDTGTRSVGSWHNADELAEAVLPFKIGTYSFSLVTVCNNIILADTKSYTIKKGTNNLTFTPKIAVISSSSQGKGNLNVSLRFDAENVAKVVCGLYTIEGRKVSGYNDQELEITEGGNCAYTKQNVHSGNYLVIFKFYADDDKKQLLGMYREYAVISNGMTSSSECEIDAVGSLFNIEYVTNGGSFADGFTAPASYTRLSSSDITLPSADNISKTNCTFGGWYDNADFKGDVLTKLPSGTAGDKTFYAKWLENATILFGQNDANAAITTTSQSVVKGVDTNLLTASQLGLVAPADKRFMGWSKSGNLPVEYVDGDAVTVTDNTMTLYAVWSVSKISPTGQNDNTDTDGDGLTDWAELNTYHTDPSNTDTDGDGWTDYDEVNGMYESSTNIFNPLIADVPALEVVFVGKPVFSYNYTTSTGGSDTQTISYSDGTSGSTSSTSTNSHTRNETHGWNTKLGASYTYATTGSSGTISVEAGYNGSVMSGDTYTYSESASSSWSKNWSNGKSVTNTSSKTVTGGGMTIQTKLKNPSNIAYTVESVTIAVNRIPNNSSDARVPVKSMTFPNTATIGPGGESGIYNIGASFDSPGAIETLTKYSTGLEMSVSGYKITMTQSGKMSYDFTESLTKVKAKTAAVYIDWGNLSDRKSKTYNVSVKNLYNKDATSINDLYTQPDLEYIFQNVLNYTKDTHYTLNSNGCLQSLHGVTNQSSNKNGAWFICHKYTVNDERKAAFYAPYTSTTGLTEDQKWKLSDIKLSAGDEVSIIYTVDKDGDGVPLNEELICGTSDDKVDTDGDGLTDYEEIYGWYKSHLDGSKYSDSKKVCTNPRLTDSDGDDLPDNTDTDPIIPKMKNDTRLGTIQYSADGSRNSFTNFSFNSSGEATLNNLNESIYLNITPKVSFAFVHYDSSASGEFTEEIDPTKPIKLNVGENTIYIRCTAPDETTTKIYKLIVNSKFKDMTGFTAVSPRLGGGTVNLTWNASADARATSSDGGYVLYGVKSDTLGSPTLLRANAGSASDSASLTGDEFYLKCNSSISGGTMSLNLSPNATYCLYMFAFAHKDKDSTYQSTLLGKAKVKAGANREAMLAIYAHYIYDYEDQDGGCDPEFYWSFDGGKITNMSNLNIGRSDSKKFDDDDVTAYCFGEGKMHDYGNDPGRFSGCTKTITQMFTRDKDISFTATWKAWEKDKGSAEDHLGKVTANFSYSASQDRWSCSWSASEGKDGKTESNPGSSSITAGDKSWGNHWDLRNESYGEIGFYWDWSWDVEPVVKN